MDAYEAYIASPEWRQKRQEALVRDGHRCRVCNASEQLEVHHRSYGPSLGLETLDDLTTLCADCHKEVTTFLRRRRYRLQAPDVSDYGRVTPARAEIRYELSDIEVSSHRRITPGHAQRQASEPARPDCEGDEAGICEKSED
ncbi:hypothetical protein DC522_01405 [Microvirga sp. KLBC 81]|nr:hypothetical protein DC522_01405 [Microvirga sp. KLBC 81]